MRGLASLLHDAKEALSEMRIDRPNMDGCLAQSRNMQGGSETGRIVQPRQGAAGVNQFGLC
jgi:hypothetical protein